MTSSYPYPATEPSYRPSPPAGDPTAVMGRRVAAWLVDSIIVTAPAAVLASRDFEFVRSDEQGRTFDSFDDTSDFCDRLMDADDAYTCVPVPGIDRAYIADNFTVGGVTGGWLLAFGLAILINVLIQGLRGWTPGKLLFGLRTTAEDGQPPGIGRAVIRWLLFIVDDLCAGLVGFIVALTSRGHRRVGDMAAKTFVVGKKHMGSPILVPGMTTGYSSYGYPGYPGGPPRAGGPGGPTAPGGPGGPGGPGAGWGAQPGPPGESPQAWAPPPAWGPARQRAEQGPPTTEPRRAGAAPASEAPGRDAAATEQPRADAPTAAEPGTPGYNPQWDPARGTYIVWSAERGHWLGWDDTAKEWKRL